MAKEPSITNTSKQPPELHLTDALLVGASESIVASERRGAAELAAQRSRLPTEGSDAPAWTKIGVVFGAVDATDPLFRVVTLPPGWRIDRTESDLWTDLLDDKGRKRASIFYKAAFYDRVAHVALTCRFKVSGEYSDSGGPSRTVIVDRAVGAPLRTWPWRDGWDEQRKDRDEAMAFLRSEYPEHSDPAAYWDDGSTGG